MSVNGSKVYSKVTERYPSLAQCGIKVHFTEGTCMEWAHTITQMVDCTLETGV